MIDAGVFRGALASEWTKLRSVRSTYWCVLAAIVLGIGIGAAASAGNAHSYNQMSLQDRLTFDPTAISLAGLFFAQLALGVLAIMAVSSEYSTGTIRTSLCAVPQRGYVLGAKALLTSATCLVVALGTAFGSYEIGQLIFSGHHLNSTLSEPGVLRAVIGGGLYIAGLALLAMGLAAIIRHTAGAITALVGVVFILPIVTSFLPDDWQRFTRFLPATAGGAITTVVRTGTSLAPWAGYAVFLGWAALLLGIGWYLLRSRDV